jgi:hypothetical protein
MAYKEDEDQRSTTVLERLQRGHEDSSYKYKYKSDIAKPYQIYVKQHS